MEEDKKIFIRIHGVDSFVPNENRLLILLQDEYSYGYYAMEENQEEIVRKLDEYLNDETVEGLYITCSELRLDIYELIEDMYNYINSKYETSKNIWLRVRDQTIDDIFNAEWISGIPEDKETNISLCLSCIIDSKVDESMITRKRMIDMNAVVEYINKERKLPEEWPVMEKYKKE